MNFMTYLKKLIASFLRKNKEKHKPLISLLIPFSSTDPERIRNFRWLLEYWECELPDAEIVIGRSNGRIFCKNEAFNDAASRAKGDILVLLDADAYLDGKVIKRCANKIVKELEKGNRLWYVPYRQLFRLTECITQDIITSCPCEPLRLPCPPSLDCVTENGHKSRYGHRYAAMATIIPKEALDAIGCFDERFKGWGGEDIALLRALDTLWGKHKTTNNCIFHLWHAFIGDDYKTRRWKNQRGGGSNDKLANEYNRARRQPFKMRKLVDEGCEYRRRKHKWWKLI